MSPRSAPQHSHGQNFRYRSGIQFVIPGRSLASRKGFHCINCKSSHLHYGTCTQFAGSASNRNRQYEKEWQSFNKFSLQLEGHKKLHLMKENFRRTWNSFKITFLKFTTLFAISVTNKASESPLLVEASEAITTLAVPAARSGETQIKLSRHHPDWSLASHVIFLWSCD